VGFPEARWPSRNPFIPNDMPLRLLNCLESPNEAKDKVSFLELSFNLCRKLAYKSLSQAVFMLKDKAFETKAPLCD